MLEAVVAECDERAVRHHGQAGRGHVLRNRVAWWGGGSLEDPLSFGWFVVDQLDAGWPDDDEVVVAALLGDPAVGQNDDLVGAADGTEPPVLSAASSA